MGLDEIPILPAQIPGVGGIDLIMEVSFGGTFNCKTSGYLVTGLSYSKANGFRIIKNFNAKSFSFTCEANASAGLKVRMGITGSALPIKGYVYSTAGGKAVFRHTAYDDGLPKECVTVAAYLYASTGADASIKFGSILSASFNKDVEIFGEDNSPIRTYHHYEDGKEVTKCSRGNDFKYYTNINSRYWGNGWTEGLGDYGYDANGKAITKNVLGKTQAEVKDKLRTAIEDSKKLDPVKAGRYTLEQWLKLWYSVYVEPQVRYSTREFYHNAIDHHIIPKLGNVKLEKLTMLQIQQFYNELLKSGRVQKKNQPELKEHGLSPRMVQCVHVVLNKALEYAVGEKLILANPAKKCKIPKNTCKEMNILPEALIGPYLSAAKEHGILAPMYLELTTGLRRGELLALRWEDLDVQNRTLSINKSVARQDGKLVISTPKTPNSIRTVLLPEDTVKLLVEEHERHPANPYLFPSPRTGETWDPDGFRRLHDRIIKEIGAEHVRFHDMRHTFATLSLKSGVDVRTLSETLGHFSAGFTLSTYVHSTPGMKQSAADAIGNTIRNAI